MASCPNTSSFLLEGMSFIIRSFCNPLGCFNTLYAKFTEMLASRFESRSMLNIIQTPRMTIVCPSGLAQRRLHWHFIPWPLFSQITYFITAVLPAYCDTVGTREKCHIKQIVNLCNLNSTQAERAIKKWQFGTRCISIKEHHTCICIWKDWHIL